MTGTTSFRLDDLACPRCHGPLSNLAFSEYTSALGGAPHRRAGAAQEPDPQSVLLCGTCARAYPVLDGMPVLLAPEALAPSPFREDVSHPYYAEAYSERPHYNAIATQQARDVTRSPTFRSVARAVTYARAGILQLPTPADAWLDQMPDTEAHWDAYRHLGDVRGRRVLQLGGKGTNVVRMLLAGASVGWLLTPMPGEIEFARALASYAGVADRLRGIVGVAEQAPLRDAALDAIFVGGCTHHMQTERVFHEIARILAPGGRFSAVEPWRAPLYGIGTRVFGKREPNPFCRPLTRARVATFASAFRRATVVHHGTFLRYPLIVAQKAGLRPGLTAARWIMRVDDRLASVCGLRRFGSCVALLAER